MHSILFCKPLTTKKCLLCRKLLQFVFLLKNRKKPQVWSVFTGIITQLLTVWGAHETPQFYTCRKFFVLRQKKYSHNGLKFFVESNEVTNFLFFGPNISKVIYDFFSFETELQFVKQYCLKNIKQIHNSLSHTIPPQTLSLDKLQRC